MMGKPSKKREAVQAPQVTELDIEFKVTIQEVHCRTGFNRLEVVRIKRQGEEWRPEQSWTAWFDRWRKKR